MSSKNLWTCVLSMQQVTVDIFARFFGKVGRVTIRDWLLGSHQSLLSVFSLYSVHAVGVLLSDGAQCDISSLTQQLWSEMSTLSTTKKALYSLNTQKLEWFSPSPLSYFSLSSSGTCKKMNAILLTVCQFKALCCDSARCIQESGGVVVFPPRTSPYYGLNTALSLSHC